MCLAVGFAGINYHPCKVLNSFGAGWESRHTWEFSIITACISLSRPDFVVVTRDELWVWVEEAGRWLGSGWPNLRISPYLGILVGGVGVLMRTWQFLYFVRVF